MTEQYFNGTTTHSPAAIVLRIALLGAATFVAMMVFSLPQLSDPLIRWDDFPAYFGDEDAFFEKTLREGRWLNYWWISRPFLWPAWVNFVAYHAGWAVFAAGAAVCVLGAQTHFTRLVLLSVLIALSPQAFLISGWFNTLVLAVWFLALYAILMTLVSPKAGLFVFAIFAPVSMLFYSTYPFVLICFCAFRHDAELSVRRFVGLVLLLAFGVAAGMMLMYGLNYLEFGRFDIELDQDRQYLPVPETFADIIANAQYVMRFLLLWLVQSIAYGTSWLGFVIFGLLAVAYAIFLRNAPLRMVYSLGFIAVFIGIIAVHGIKEGIMIPIRSQIAIWMVIAIALFQAAWYLKDRLQAKHIDLALLVLVALVGGQSFKNAALLAPWQAETQRIAEMVPPGTERIVLWADYVSLEGSRKAHILHHEGLTMRLKMLTGAEVVLCDAACTEEPPIATSTDQVVAVSPSEAHIVLVDKP